MRPSDRVILQKMIAYCDDILDMVAQFGDSFDAYRRQKPYQYATAMCILQIGELVNRLSEEAMAETVQVPWRLIRAMRNVFAHNYDRAEPALMWQTLTEDIPVLKRQLQAALEAGT